MTKSELVKRAPSQMPTSIDAWTAMKEQAQVLVKSGFLPSSIKTPEQALSIGLAGRELGIGFMEAIRSINVIQGKPTISPQLMLALANRTGELEDIFIDATDERCVVKIKRKRRKEHIEEFGVKEATALGLMGRDNYNKQRATMFKWRALAANLRVSFPDVVLGLYTPEEMGAEVKESDDGQMEVVHSNGKKEPAWPHPAEITISHDERLELVRTIKEKGISVDEFKDHLKATYGIEGTAGIKKTDYAKVYEWIIKNQKDAVNG